MIIIAEVTLSIGSLCILRIHDYFQIYCRKMRWVQAIRSYIERLKMPMALVI